MRRLRHKQLAVAAGVFTLATAAAAQPDSTGGLGVGELLASAPLKATELVARARVNVPAEKAKPVAKHAAPKGKGGVPLSDLLAGGAMPMSELVDQASGAAPKKPAAPTGLATELPKALKNPAAAAPTVTVTIPPTPQAKPIAQLAQPARVEPERKIAAAPIAPAQATLFVDEMTLEIIDTGRALAFKPQSLVFPKAGMKAKIKLNGKAPDGLTLFVRDAATVALEQKSGELRAERKGVTELYAVAGGKMYIVPVTVAEGGGELDLKVPDALVSLDGVFQGKAQSSALYPGLEQATGPSLNDSVAEVARTALADEREQNRYYDAKAELGYKAVTIQVVDDRSAPAQGKIYPVANATVRIVGTEFAAKTDAMGHLTIRDMPVDARFLLKIDDDTGAVRSSIVELQTKGATDQGVQRMRVMRGFTFDTLQSITGSGQHASYASYCATVEDHARGDRPVEGVNISVDAPAEGPYYFNRYGFLDRAQQGTGPDGRFCYFNVQPGPLGLSLYDQGQFVATLPVSTFAGRHVEQDLVLGTEKPLTTRLAAMATAHEQLSADVRAANTFKTIDMVDLIPLGGQDPMMQVGPGLVQTADGVMPAGGRFRTVVQAAEFEPTVYSYNVNASAPVTPLVPRGFIEDMSLYAQVSYNPELGVVLVDYAHPDGAGADGEAISMRLVDENGRDVGDGWYYADRPVTKAVFFNVPAGTYGLLVETHDGYWLGSDTVIVYNETVSYSRLGRAIKYRP